MKLLAFAAGALLLAGSPVVAQTAAAPAAAPATVVDAAVASPQHKTLVAAVTAADLAGVLGGEGPFTVFAPTDTAFEALPAGTVETLLKPENKETLQAVLSYHVVPGRVTAAELVRQIEAGGGRAALTTVGGATLTATVDAGKVVLTDVKGGKATVTTADLAAANGVIHVTDAVSLPG